MTHRHNHRPRHSAAVHGRVPARADQDASRRHQGVGALMALPVVGVAQQVLLVQAAAELDEQIAALQKDERALRLEVRRCARGAKGRGWRGGGEGRAGQSHCTAEPWHRTRDTATQAAGALASVLWFVTGLLLLCSKALTVHRGEPSNVLSRPPF